MSNDIVLNMAKQASVMCILDNNPQGYPPRDLQINYVLEEDSIIGVYDEDTGEEFEIKSTDLSIDYLLFYKLELMNCDDYKLNTLQAAGELEITVET